MSRIRTHNKLNNFVISQVEPYLVQWFEYVKSWYEFLSIDNTHFGICCFSAMHTALSKNKDGFARNQDNVSEWSEPLAL